MAEFAQIFEVLPARLNSCESSYIKLGTTEIVILRAAVTRGQYRRQPERVKTAVDLSQLCDRRGIAAALPVGLPSA